eukprot:TRINITY_DN9768_c0_g1_i2.p1 TRINITY_DN9768_c0_g1~~TRINITY_DN9768_c0_g1_i2.p1  ORF type:complete len:1230 (+),score=180.02 TRINITY_DN9768_c0_g1_i2:1370-5059(+)
MSLRHAGDGQYSVLQKMRIWLNWERRIVEFGHELGTQYALHGRVNFQGAPPIEQGAHGQFRDAGTLRRMVQELRGDVDTLAEQLRTTKRRMVEMEEPSEWEVQCAELRKLNEALHTELREEAARLHEATKWRQLAEEELGTLRTILLPGSNIGSVLLPSPLRSGWDASVEHPSFEQTGPQSPARALFTPEPLSLLLQWEASLRTAAEREQRDAWRWLQLLWACRDRLQRVPSFATDLDFAHTNAISSVPRTQAPAPDNTGRGVQILEYEEAHIRNFLTEWEWEKREAIGLAHAHDTVARTCHLAVTQLRRQQPTDDGPEAERKVLEVEERALRDIYKRVRRLNIGIRGLSNVQPVARHAAPLGNQISSNNSMAFFLETLADRDTIHAEQAAAFNSIAAKFHANASHVKLAMSENLARHTAEQGRLLNARGSLAQPISRKAQFETRVVMENEILRLFSDEMQGRLLLQAKQDKKREFLKQLSVGERMTLVLAEERWLRAALRNDERQVRGSVYQLRKVSQVLPRPAPADTTEAPRSPVQIAQIHALQQELADRTKEIALIAEERDSLRAIERNTKVDSERIGVYKEASERQSAMFFDILNENEQRTRRLLLLSEDHERAHLHRHQQLAARNMEALDDLRAASFQTQAISREAKTLGSQARADVIETESQCRRLLQEVEEANTLSLRLKLLLGQIWKVFHEEEATERRALKAEESAVREIMMQMQDAGLQHALRQAVVEALTEQIVGTTSLLNITDATQTVPPAAPWETGLNSAAYASSREPVQILPFVPAYRDTYRDYPAVTSPASNRYQAHKPSYIGSPVRPSPPRRPVSPTARQTLAQPYAPLSSANVATARAISPSREPAVEALQHEVRRLRSDVTALQRSTSPVRSVSPTPPRGETQSSTIRVFYDCVEQHRAQLEDTERTARAGLHAAEKDNLWHAKRATVLRQRLRSEIIEAEGIARERVEEEEADQRVDLALRLWDGAQKAATRHQQRTWHLRDCERSEVRERQMLTEQATSEFHLLLPQLRRGVAVSTMLPTARGLQPNGVGFQRVLSSLERHERREIESHQANMWRTVLEGLFCCEQLIHMTQQRSRLKSALLEVQLRTAGPHGSLLRATLEGREAALAAEQAHAKELHSALDALTTLDTSGQMWNAAGTYGPASPKRPINHDGGDSPTPSEISFLEHARENGISISARSPGTPQSPYVDTRARLLNTIQTLQALSDDPSP